MLDRVYDDNLNNNDDDESLLFSTYFPAFKYFKESALNYSTYFCTDQLHDIGLY